MDETALIAFGILLEETAREALGETGDLALTEAADAEEERIMTGHTELEEQASVQSDSGLSSGDSSQDTSDDSD